MEEGYCKECGGFMEYVFTATHVSSFKEIHKYRCKCCNSRAESEDLVFNEEE